LRIILDILCLPKEKMVENHIVNIVIEKCVLLKNKIIAMENKKLTSEIKNEIHNEMIKLPKWIDTKLSLHHEVWNLMSDCNDMLLLIINDRIASDRKIDTMVITFDRIITYMLQLLNDDERIKLCVYYTAMFQMIIDICLKEERYEVCSNIQRFYDSYFINLKKDNE